jgi:hypothetical protein
LGHAIDRPATPKRPRPGTAIEAEREAVEKKSQAEDARWDKKRVRLHAALRRARD